MSGPSLDDVLKVVRTYGAPEIAALLDSLCPCLALVPIERLIQLGIDVEQAIVAKNRVEQMRAAILASDTATEAAHEADLKNTPTGGGLS